MSWLDSSVGKTTALGGALSLGGSLGLFGDDSEDTVYEPFPGYLALAGKTTENIQNKLGQMGTLYSDTGGNFNLSTPNIESLFEGLLTSSIGNVKDYNNLVSSFSDAQQNVYKTQKAALSESYDDERKRALERYNKLGVATSTPGLQGLMEIDKDQIAAEQELAATLSAEELQYNLDVEELANTVLNTLGTQSGLLSSAQTSREEYGTTNTYEDWLRAYQEDYLWSQLAAQLVGGSSTTLQQGTSTGDTLTELGSSAIQMLPYLLML